MKLGRPDNKENDKSRFRQSVAWKRFRQQMVGSIGHCCELCGIRHSGLQARKLNVHHLRPDQYDLLEPELFKILCITCHEFVEFLVKRINGKAFKPPIGFDATFEGIKIFLSSPAREKGELMAGKIKQTNKQKETNK